MGVWLCLPIRLFTVPSSFIIEDRNGMLLGARIAADGQWRFPAMDRVPRKFAEAVIACEDRRFRVHPGFDPVALVRALVLDIRARRLVSGGSTITMQVVRLSRSNPPRTLFEKISEIAAAFKLTIRRSKNAVLSLYASHAPFGGNVVGLEAASWRYYGRNPQDLSWAESATLAVLPNEPGLVHPGRNRARLMKKRNRLLSALCTRGIIDSMEFKLSIAEPLVSEIRPLPDDSPQLLDRIAAESGKRNEGGRVRTTIDRHLQRQVSELVIYRHRALAANQIHNAAALVLDVPTGQALAYVGNVDEDSAVHGNSVDCVNAPRSTGSVLKPILYAFMLDAGELLPTTLVPDIPTSFGNYTPQNFDREFEGAVPASRALARSLNIPAARMVQQHGVARFYRELQTIGMTTMKRPADDYGISIILGGIEGTLWELTGIYAGMARLVNNFRDDPLGKTNSPPFFHPNYNSKEKKQAGVMMTMDEAPLSAGACWAALQAMVEVVRPGQEGAWKNFASSRTVAWKTGTSFGFRDGWAIGVTPKYCLGVWVGNASGEGRPDLIGIKTAAPLLFAIFNILPHNHEWFPEPEADLVKTAVCKHSGFLAGPLCEQVDTIAVPEAGRRTSPCPYHHMVHLDKSGKWRVTSACESVASMRHCSWFVLPPAIEAYYRLHHSDYRTLPAMRPDCEGADHVAAIGLIYPHGDGQIFIPHDFDGRRGKTALKAVHRETRSTIHWHLDDQYLGSTTGLHEMAVAPAAGTHRLTLIDDRGTRIERTVSVIDK